MEEFYHFQTNEINVYFRKDLSDADKYLVCTCAKNENNYIVEWIEHYLKLGFDKIIICDNNDDDSLESVISEYTNRGVVEIFNCRGFGSFQVQFYSMFCTEGNYKWCAYFDCDEFLELGVYSNIKDYLATKQNDICISFNWMTYGSGGQYHMKEGGVQERFKYPISPISLFTENCFIKSIVKGGDTFKNGCWFNGSHIPTTEPMYWHNVGGYVQNNTTSHMYFVPKYKEGYIKHYYTKSFEEWMNKASRGWPDGTDTLKAKNYFVCRDWANLPLEQMGMGLFSDESCYKSEGYINLLNNFDIIQITNSNQRVYAIVKGAFGLMHNSTGHTFCFSDPHIDDTLFNLFLEYGIRTGNRVVWTPTADDVWRVYEKYSDKRNPTYYIIDFM